MLKYDTTVRGGDFLPFIS